MDKPKGIDLTDELNLYLVANGLKPATIIVLDSLNFNDEHSVRREGNYLEVYEEADIKLRPEHMEQVKEFLGRLGVVSHQKATDTYEVRNTKGDMISVERISFVVGKDQVSLERLLHAENDEEIGLALGFPSEAVKAYKKIIDGEMRGGSYAVVCQAKAKKAGMQLPTWLAYINHAPEQLDLIGDKVSETSRSLGERYQAFVRANNSDLAKRVEQHFR